MNLITTPGKDDSLPEFSLTSETLPLLEQIAEQLPGGFFVYPENGNRELIYANHAVLDIYGCATLEEFRELTGYTFKGMVHPGDFDQIEAAINLQIAQSSDGNLDYVAYRIIRKDGSVRWVDDYGRFSHSDEYGEIYYVFISDITEKHLFLEENARRAEVIEGLSRDYDSIYLLDIDTGEMLPYRLKNDYFQKCIHELAIQRREKTGWSHIMPIYAERYVLPEDRELFLNEVSEKRILERLQSVSSYTFDYRIQNDMNHICYLQMTVVRIEGVKLSNHAVVGLHDMTEQVERVRRETEEIDRERERRANEAKDAFLFNISHDIRTPMNAIMGFSKLARNHLDDPTLAAEYLDKANESSDHLLDLIDQLLEISQLDSGNLELHPADCNLGEELGAVYDMMLLQADKKHQTLEIEQPDDLVSLDTLRFRRIISNLVSNAIKFTPKEGVIRVTARCTKVSDSGYARYEFQIIDNGIGMSEDFLKRIFQNFEREQSSTKSGQLGTGLGLAIVRRTLDIMGGTISVESEKDKGSIFTIQLPIRRVSEREPANPPKFSEQKSDIFAPDDTDLLGTVLTDNNRDNDTKAHEHRILLVEDIEINRMLAEVVLQEAGYLVEAVPDGCDAVDAVRSHPEGYYSLILMDIQMPVMNGYEATRAIRALNRPDTRHIPIFALSANARDEDRRKSLDCGMNLHIPKPFDAPQMISAIQSYLDEGQKHN